MDQPTAVNPTLGIRWCLDPKDQAKLVELKAVNVHVLIVVRYEGGQEDRQLLPLTDAMTYLMLRFPGTHTIHSRLFWGSDAAKLRAYFLQRSDRNGYNYSVLDTENNTFWEKVGNPFVVDDGYSQIDCYETDVTVGAEHFARDWHPLIKKWVNYLYSYQPVDECQFRKRLIGAFTWQPLWMALFLVCRTIGTTIAFIYCALIGARGLNFRPILHPFTMSIGDIWPEFDHRVDGRFYGFRRTAWTLHDKKGQKRSHYFLLSPLFYLFCFIPLHFLAWKFSMSYGELLSVVWVVWIGVWSFFRTAVRDLVLALKDPEVLGILIAMVLVIAVLFAKIMWQNHTSSDKYRSAKRQAVLERERQQLEEAYQYLTCPRTSDPVLAVSIGALPKERRTLRLRFQAIKRDICRPYAR